MTTRSPLEHDGSGGRPETIAEWRYRCRIASGELFNSKSGTPGYKLKLVVLEGDHVDRVVWHDVWLSEPALPMAKRDLGKLGVTTLEQLERPLPDGIIVNAKLALRKNDDGRESNRVARLDLIAIQLPEPEPFGLRRARRRLDDRRGRFRLGSGATKWSTKRMTSRPFGFRVVGHKTGRRRLVDWRAAFAAYAECDDESQPNGKPT